MWEILNQGAGQVRQQLGTNGERKFSINFVVNLPSPHVSSGEGETTAEQVKLQKDLKLFHLLRI